MRLGAGWTHFPPPGYLGYAYGRAGRQDDARDSLAELDARKQHSYVPPYFPALVLSGLGQYDLALDHLEQAFRERDTMLRDLKADAAWDRMHSLPRFETLMQRMGFPDPPKTADRGSSLSLSTELPKQS